MNNCDAAKLSMSQATFHLCPSIFLSTLIILTLSSKKTHQTQNFRKPKTFPILCYLFPPLLWQFLLLPKLMSTSPAALPSSVFLYFSLPHILAFPSILGSLPHSRKKLWKNNSCPKTNFSSVTQRLFPHPYSSLTQSDFTKHRNFFQKRALSLGKGLVYRLRAVGPRGFSDPGLKFNPEKAAMALCPLPWGTESCPSGRRMPHVLTLQREQNRLLLILAGRSPGSDNPSAEPSRHSGERDEKKGLKKDKVKENTFT